MPFGKHKGKTLDDIANTVPSYFLFLTRSEADGILKRELERIMSNPKTKKEILQRSMGELDL